MTTGHCDLREFTRGSFDELQNSAQAAVDPQTKPADLAVSPPVVDWQLARA